MGRSAILFLLSIIVSSAANANSQCTVERNPLSPVISQVQSDSVFELFKAELSSMGGTTPTEIEKDYLILPGKRVGQFSLGTSVKDVQALTPLLDQGTRKDPNYSSILPLGYVPERNFRSEEKTSLRFAFSTQNEFMREVFVTDEKYHTPDGVRIGTSKSALIRRKKLKGEYGADGRIYFREPGITYIVKRDSIVEIVVIQSR